MNNPNEIELASSLVDNSIFYIKSKPLCEDAGVSAGAVRLRKQHGTRLLTEREAKAILERFRSDCRKFFPELERGGRNERRA